MTNTLRLVATKDADKLTVVVVLPTPPFWLATAIIRPTKHLNDYYACKCGVKNPLEMLI
jgi:hypothetical protein